MLKNSKKMQVKIVIPSMDRHDRVKVKKILKNCIICVPETQKSLYLQYNSDYEILSHPDNLKGLAAKRQWIYEKFKNVFMIDDDVTSCLRVYEKPATKLKNNEVEDIIQNCANICQMSGAFLFGFNHQKNDVFYPCHKPFSLSGYIPGHAIGILWNKTLNFGKLTAVEDYYISCINAYYNRKAFIDNRFIFVQEKTYKNVGGLSNYRTNETEKTDTLELRKIFGEVIQLKNEKSGGNSKVKSQPSSKYARTLNLPF